MFPCLSGFVVMLLSFNFSTHYTTDILAKYKDTFSAEPGNDTDHYMVEPIPLSIIQTIASIWLISHSLRCETVGWGISDESCRMCATFPETSSHFDTMLCVDHIQLWFPHIFDQTWFLHEFLSQSLCALPIPTFISKVLEHWHFHMYYMKTVVYLVS